VVTIKSIMVAAGDNDRGRATTYYFTIIDYSVGSLLYILTIGFSSFAVDIHTFFVIFVQRTY